MPSQDTDVPTQGPQHRGRWFEDYVAGEVIHTPARTITAADVAAFAGLSWDTNPLHTDAEFARRTPFRGQIAHGMLIQSIASGLAAQTGIFDGTILAFESSNASFLQAVRFDDTVHVRITTREIDAEPTRRRGRITLAIDVFNQEQKCVSAALWNILVLRRPGAAPNR